MAFGACFVQSRSNTPIYLNVRRDLLYTSPTQRCTDCVGDVWLRQTANRILTRIYCSGLMLPKQRT